MSSFDNVLSSRSAPAFPTTIKPHPQTMRTEPINYHGLSIWQYFAAHAPAIPNWFMPEDESDGIPSTHGLNEANKRQLAMVLGNMLSRNDASQEVRSFMVKFDEAKDGRAAAKRKALEHRFFAWRKYYADMMIQAGSEKP